MPACHSNRAFTGPCPALAIVSHGKGCPSRKSGVLSAPKCGTKTCSVEVIGMPAPAMRFTAAASSSRRPMCGVCTSTAGIASSAASVSMTLTACVIVGRLRFFPSSTISFNVRVSGPPGVAVMTVLM
jgi:hypothetical protein